MVCLILQKKRRSVEGTPEQNVPIGMDIIRQQSEPTSPRYVLHTPDPDRTTPDPDRTTPDPNRTTPDPVRTTLDPDRTTAQPTGTDADRSGYEVPISHYKKPAEEPIYHEVDDPKEI